VSRTSGEKSGVNKGEPIQINSCLAKALASTSQSLDSENIETRESSLDSNLGSTTIISISAMRMRAVTQKNLDIYRSSLDKQATSELFDFPYRYAGMILISANLTF
jgi:hypothetical protein